jgi:hypothetical protein
VFILGWLVSRGVDDPLVAEARRIRNNALVGANDEIRTLGGLLGPSKVSGRSSMLTDPNSFRR